MTPVYSYRFANVEFDEARQRLRVGGADAVVERLPLQLLSVLLRRPDEVVSRDELLAILWEGRLTVDHVVANAVSKLRRALGAEAGPRIVNVPRQGYRFTGPIERLAVGRQQAPVQALTAGEAVPGRGDFVLARMLAHSPGGAVWVARRKRLDRTRVYKFAYDGETKAAIQREFTVCRLLNEALGRRPDLPTIEDYEFAAPPCFIAFEDGGPDLASWAATTGGLTSMSEAGRVALFLGIARAVAAAHGVGVLHRDLKPSNVLIRDAQAGSGAANVRVIDFGSSHLIDPARLAAHGVTALGMTVNDAAHPWAGTTPNYLAPELLAGEEATSSSDVYALGLILYQLVVADLRRPLANGWETDIADPFLVDDVRAATEGRPDRRLESVVALIARLETLPDRRRARDDAARAAQFQAIAEQAVRARRRRNRTFAAVACAVIALAVFGALRWQARVEEQRGDLATARAAAISEFLIQDVLRTAPSGRAVSAGDETVLGLMQRASDRAGERFKDDPAMLARVRRQFGDWYLRIRFTEQAEDQYRRAMSMLEQFGTAEQSAALEARFGLAHALTDDDALDDAQAVLSTTGTRWLDGNSILARDAHIAWVRLLMSQQRFQEALPLATRLVALVDAWADDTRTEADRRIQVREWLAEIQTRLGDRAAAERTIAELSKPPFNASGIQAVVFTNTSLDVANQALREERLDDAERVLVALRESPQRERTAWQTARLQEDLSEVYRHGGRWQQALAASETALAAYREALGDHHARVTLAAYRVAACELELDRPAAALARLTDARARVKADVRHGALLRSIDLARARALTSLGRADEAIELIDDIGPIDAKQAGAVPILLRAELGRALIATGRSKEGQALLAKALDDLAQSKVPAWQWARYRTLVARS